MELLLLCPQSFLHKSQSKLLKCNVSILFSTLQWLLIFLRRKYKIVVLHCEIQMTWLSEFLSLSLPLTLPQLHQLPHCNSYTPKESIVFPHALWASDRRTSLERLSKLPKVMQFRNNGTRIPNQVNPTTSSVSFYSTPLHKFLMSAWLLSNRFHGGSQSFLRKGCSAFLGEPWVFL